MATTIVIYLIVNIVLGALFGFYLGRFTSGVILYLLWAALVIALLLLLVAPLGALVGLAQDDWNRSAYIFLSWIFVAPVLVSSLLTGWLGLRQRRAIIAKDLPDA